MVVSADYYLPHLTGCIDYIYRGFCISSFYLYVVLSKEGNLKQDPDEPNNLFDKEPEVGQRFLTLIQDNLQKG
jgi:hypothetical protein